MKKILKVAVILVMVFTVSLSVDQSYAYWYSIAPANTDTTGTVETGTWTAIFEWTSTATYSVGDIVSFNGTTWISLKASNANKEPSLSKPGSNWWVPYTP